jgi:LytS/YehU family sensor histidine kinase
VPAGGTDGPARCWMFPGAPPTSARNGEMLQLEVRDTGARGGSPTPSTRIGLANSRARLAQLYGDRHQLALSADEHGTVVKVLIPFRCRLRLSQ